MRCINYFFLPIVIQFTFQIHCLIEVFSFLHFDILAVLRCTVLFCVLAHCCLWLRYFAPILLLILLPLLHSVCLFADFSCLMLFIQCAENLCNSPWSYFAAIPFRFVLFHSFVVSNVLCTIGVALHLQSREHVAAELLLIPAFSSNYFFLSAQLLYMASKVLSN